MSESQQPQARNEGYWSNLAEQADRESEQEAARYYGMRGEQYAQERFGMILYETGHSDALLPYDHPQSDRDGDRDDHLPGDRRKVQIKGARLAVKRGDGGRAGRFRLWEPDHEILTEQDGLYLFLGYDPTEPSPVQCVRFVEPGELDALAPGDGVTWYDAEHSTKDGRPTDLSVKRVFP